eukprot:PLAT6868.4.p1 GENE.PLAT6868.4~~PLAT6868.4.p1  ORF type:complete len:270 (+),score=90.92 PLAT6868.4:122-931(+)
MQPSPRRSSVSIASTASGGGRGSPQAPAKSSKVAAKAAGATSPEKSMARSALATSWHSRRQRAVTISATDLPRPAAAVLLSAIAVVLALLLVIAPALRASAYVEHSCRVAGVATVAAQCDCGVKSCLPRQPCLQLTMWLLDGRRDGSARLAVMDERALSRPDINCTLLACSADGDEPRQQLAAAEADYSNTTAVRSCWADAASPASPVLLKRAFSTGQVALATALPLAALLCSALYFCLSYRAAKSRTYPVSSKLYTAPPDEAAADGGV